MSWSLAHCPYQKVNRAHSLDVNSRIRQDMYYIPSRKKCFREHFNKGLLMHSGIKNVKKVQFREFRGLVFKVLILSSISLFFPKKLLTVLYKIVKGPKPTTGLYYCVDEFTTWLTDNKSFCNKISEENSTDLKGKSNFGFYKHYKCKK